jgi:hypothetical protein
MAARCASVGPWANAGAIMNVIAAIDPHIIAARRRIAHVNQSFALPRKPPLQPK